jgi:hypothetical protein
VVATGETFGELAEAVDATVPEALLAERPDLKEV